MTIFVKFKKPILFSPVSAPRMSWGRRIGWFASPTLAQGDILGRGEGGKGKGEGEKGEARKPGYSGLTFRRDLVKSIVLRIHIVTCFYLLIFWIRESQRCSNWRILLMLGPSPPIAGA